MPALAAAIKSEVSALYADKPGISEGDRLSQLEALDREASDAELTEESLIRAAESSGFPIPRRAGADPRAVLASGAAMP